KNVNLKDFEVEAFGDFRFITEGEMAPDGSGPVKFREGIEVGQVFELGTEYSEAMNLTVLNDKGKSVPVLMGCYGIGISRTLSAIVVNITTTMELCGLNQSRHLIFTSL